MNAIPTARLYGSAIAIVSGAYSIGSALTAAMDAPMMWVMLVIGGVVMVHGLVLLTPAAAGIGGVSGPLMIVWAIVMLATQWLAATMPGARMGGMMQGPMSWDGGMLAIAVLMLVSGLIMTARRSSGSSAG